MGIQAYLVCPEYNIPVGQENSYRTENTKNSAHPGSSSELSRGEDILYRIN
jgi:hypothetical protein